ncbi:Streptogramin A acetyltransferase [Fuerstiella marisgermanici]|uniref:Streptogramin A acetyltransferase n=1 Tax=Fuerstiella marisgermanici TaxID=1891926 RepID=A0A1P8WPE7_9PLAN|nr:Streptogramin A acetyltransferase [Fuerstiella marisgermanici]
MLRSWQFDELGQRAAIAPNVQIEVYGDLTLGRHVTLRQGCILRGTGSLSIGDRTVVNQNTIITAMQQVTIGADCMLAPGVYILDVDHKFESRERPIRDQGYRTSAAKIGDDVWLGAVVFILKGVTTGNGAIIAANSVVIQDVPPFTIFGGSPARKLRDRN